VKNRSAISDLMLLFVFIAILACSQKANCSATNVYVTPSGSATGNCPTGTASAPNLTPAQFNTSTSWGSGAGLIGPGTSILLCGTFTGAAGSTELKFQASGTSGYPITLLFDTNAQLNAPYWAPSPNGGCGGAICIYKLSYIVINGGSNGIIQNTANGDSLTYQVDSEAIEAGNCSNCTIENLTIANIYVHLLNGNSSIDQTAMRCITFSGSNVTVNNNTMHDAGWCLFEGYNNGDSNVAIYNNKLYNIDHGWMLASGTAGGSSGPFSFYGNQISSYANWDTTSDAYHHDGIHCFTAASTSLPAHITALNIYDNMFGPGVGTNITAHIFIEGGSTSGDTPCADSTSVINIYNNVLTANGPVSNGLIAFFTGTGNIYNNTLVGSGTSTGMGFYMDETATGYLANLGPVTFKNNALTSFNESIAIPTGITFTTDYNSYGGGGSNNFICGSNFYATSQFAAWKTCTGGDSHSTYSASLNLTAMGAPQTGSSVTGIATDLTSLGIVSLDNDTSAGGMRTPVLRSSTGTWDAGAYMYRAPSPPTSLTASVVVN
jgi:hypothetical protein